MRYTNCKFSTVTEKYYRKVQKITGKCYKILQPTKIHRWRFSLLHIKISRYRTFKIIQKHFHAEIDDDFLQQVIWKTCKCKFLFHISPSLDLTKCETVSYVSINGNTCSCFMKNELLMCETYEFRIVKSALHYLVTVDCAIQVKKVIWNDGCALLD